MQSCKVLELQQVQNPDFEKNMQKIGQSSGSPAGLMALRGSKRCTTLCSAKSTEKRTDKCLYQNTIPRLWPLVTKTLNLCSNSCRRDTRGANFYMPHNSAKCSNSTDECSIQTWKTICKKIGQSSGSPAGLMASRRVKTGYNSIPILFGCEQQHKKTTTCFHF